MNKPRRFPVWADVEDAYKAVGQQLVLGVRKQFIPEGLKHLADQAFIRSRNTIFDQRTGAEGALSHHDLIFFAHLAEIYSPDLIVVGSDDCGWNLLCLTYLFSDARVADIRDPDDLNSKKFDHLADRALAKMGLSPAITSPSIERLCQSMIDADKVFFLSRAGGGETLQADIRTILDGCAVRPTVIIWRIHDGELQGKISEIAGLWPGEVSFIRRSSNMGIVLHGSALPDKVKELLGFYEESTELLKSALHEERPAQRLLTQPETPIFMRLISLYRDKGFKVMFGAESRFFGIAKDAHWATLCGPASEAPELIDTWVNNIGTTDLDDVLVPFDVGQGIAMVELYLFQSLAHVFDPKTIFIVGNAFGWSTIGLSMIFPNAKIVAIDNLSECSLSRLAFELSKQIVEENGLNASVVEGTSPQDVENIVDEHLSGSIDLAFIDGLHTDEQQWLDYAAIKPLLSPSAAVLFHDVLMTDILKSFRDIAADWGGPAKVLTRTPSGMGLLHTDDLSVSVGAMAKYFTDPAFGVKVP